ncbi:MAG: arsenosugar biosynthesis radical SAM protein ArsS [Candidatus Thermoplasmatota archaeon]|nr:arsenosugar biosynthesis radical SAM protein ArsS [Candidatus Thermoplasmatota archaeon]
MPNEDSFAKRIREIRGSTLESGDVHTFQVNVGLICNQECHHCHHRAGSERDELMDRDTMMAIVVKAKEAGVKTVDITGGAPEMVPHIKEFILALKNNGHRIMFRTNLTAFLDEPYRDFPHFLSEIGVEVIASLPCYYKEETDCLRGDGVFHKSIEGLKVLNGLGYGIKKGLPLHLVYNPYEPFLPPPQQDLEKDYKRILRENHGIEFTDLYSITNMPMGRFLDDLREKGLEEEYMKLLTDNFNPDTVEALMCLGQINIGWDGKLYDCDFNQAMGMDISIGGAKNIVDIDAENIPKRPILTGDHCFGCSAGSGSSCGGALVDKE